MRTINKEHCSRIRILSGVFSHRFNIPCKIIILRSKKDKAIYDIKNNGLKFSKKFERLVKNIDMDYFVPDILFEVNSNNNIFLSYYLFQE